MNITLCRSRTNVRTVIGFFVAALAIMLTVQPGKAQTTVPPLLVETTPQHGQSWSGEPVIFTFDQDMDDESGAYLTVTPAVPGTTTVDGQQLIFMPSAGAMIEPGQRYRLNVDTRATAVAGERLVTPAIIVLTGAVPLKVTATQPGGGVTDIDVTSPIVVSFNRPVVPLSGIDEQAGLPQPLTIEPAVNGEGQWLNTSTYLFEAEPVLAGGTDYVVTVAALTGLSDDALEQPYSFQFRTKSAKVVELSPASDQAAPDTSIKVMFNQPMAPAATEAAFSLFNVEDASGSTAGNLPVEGQFGWNSINTVLTFTPTVPLQSGGLYSAEVSQEARNASGNQVEEGFAQTFEIAPLPQVSSVTPADEAVGVDPDSDLIIRFNTAISPTSALANIQVSPLLTTTRVFSFYSDYNNEVTLSWFKEPLTRYTVTVSADLADDYGNVIGQTRHFHFETGDYSSFVRVPVERFTHFTGSATAYTETRVSVLHRNMPSVEVELFKLPVGEFHLLAGNNQWELWQDYHVPNPDENRIWTRQYPTETPRNVIGRQVISLTDEIGNGLAPGIYLLEVVKPLTALSGIDAADREESAINNELLREQKVIIVSDLHLTVKKSQEGDSLAWLTHLTNGEPLSDKQVIFWSEGVNLADDTTTEAGIATANIPFTELERWSPLVVMSGSPGDQDFAIASSGWNNGLGSWEFGISSGYLTESYRMTFYTDRPIYRPGQTVNWKGIVRSSSGGQYDLPPQDLPLALTLRDDRGNVLLEETVTPNEFGSLNGSIALSDDATTGYYYLEAVAPDGERSIYSGMGFQVATYRKPDFEVNVTTDAVAYRSGETIVAQVHASYFSGGPATNANVTWRVLAEPFNFVWQDSPADRSYSFTYFDPERSDQEPFFNFGSTGLILEGSGVTNSDGMFEVAIPADLSLDSQSQIWTIEFTVQSNTNQFVSGRTRVDVHKSDYYIGLSPQRYVMQTDEEAIVDIISLTPLGERYSNAEIEITIQAYEWNSVYERGPDGSYFWRSSVQRTPVATQTITTDSEGSGQIRWQPQTGGQYQIVARSLDEPVRSAVFVYVTDQSFIAWQRTNHDRIELVADRDQYEPGDTAHVLIPSPFALPVKALVTLERGGVLESRVIDLESNSHSLEIPITAEQIPNIYLSVVLIKGIDETNPTPAMRLGYVQLNVDTAQKELGIDVKTNTESVSPGDVVTYTLEITDSTGDPVPDADISVALVDKAIFSLASATQTRLVDLFYSTAGLGVETGALLNINQDRLSQQLSEGTKGGGGGGGPGGEFEIREDFPDVAYWRATLLTDVDGQVTFSTRLPDNLTTWRLVVRAVSSDTLVGETQHDLVATQDLQIRALVPRFAIGGDELQIGAALINRLDADLDSVSVSLVLSGATVLDPSSTLNVALEAGEERSFDWPIVVGQGVDEFSMQVIAVSDTASDAIRLTVPVIRYETKEVVSTAGTVDDRRRVEGVRVPTNATGQGELRIILEPSLAAGMIEGLDYLRHYPYECTEQTVSRFLPNLYTMAALQKLALQDESLSLDLEEQLEIGIQQLIVRQNSDGGWGYWPNEESSRFISAYVLWGLWHAQELGFAVNEITFTAGLRYLEDGFEAPADIRDRWRLNEMAFVLFVLAEMDHGDPGRTSTLYDERERLQLYGRAFLAQALAKTSTPADRAYQPGSDPRVESLLDNLFATAELTATGAFWAEEDVDYRTLNSNLRTTAIVLDTFVRLAPDEPLLPLAVRWLMDVRQDGRWPTTQENVWAILALTDWLLESDELQAGYDWQVQVNDQTIGNGATNPQSTSPPIELRVAVRDLLKEQTNILAIERSNASGQLTYATHLQTYADAMSVDARDRGIVVDRAFALDGKQTSGVRVGDVVSVTTTIVASTDLYHVLVEVPIPAGTEPIDNRLETESSQFEQPVVEVVGAQEWWRSWTPTFVDIRDDKVALFSTFLQAGTVQYTFQVRATVPGEYGVLPAYAEQMYFPEVWGRSAAMRFMVE